AARLRPDAADGDARRGALAARVGEQIGLAHRRRRRAARSYHQASIRDVSFRYVWTHRLRLLPDRAVHPVPDCASAGEFTVRPFAHVSERKSVAFISDRNFG